MRRLTRPDLAMVLCLAVLAPAGPASAQLRQVDDAAHRRIGPSALYRDDASVMASYAAAMARYRATAPGQVRAGESFFSAPASSPPVPWTWTAQDGDTVRRLEDGSYRISLSRPLGNWFAEVDCRIELWPELSCSDGRRRKMAAPTATSMTLDGKPFDLVRVP